MSILKINESFDKLFKYPTNEGYKQGIPDWLAKFLQQEKNNNWFRNKNIDLNNFRWVEIAIPQTPQEKKSLKDNNKMFFFQLPSDEVYVYNYLDDEKSRYYGKYFRYVPLKTILEDTISLGYIDLAAPESINKDLKDKRKENKKGLITRGRGQYQERPKIGYEYEMSGYKDSLKPILGDPEWYQTGNEDKSGYIMDPDRLIRKFYKVDLSNYGDRLESLYKRLMKIKKTISDYIINYDIKDISNTDSLHYYRNDNFLDNISKLSDRFSDAVSKYREILFDIDKIFKKYEDKTEIEEHIQEIFGNYKNREDDWAYKYSDIAKLHEYIKDTEKVMSEMK